MSLSIPAVGRFEHINKQKARIASAIFLFLLILGLLLPMLTYPDPPPGQEGILVNLGLPDMGQGNENAPAPEVETPSEEPVTSEPEVETAPPVQEEVKEEKPEPKKPDPKPTKEVVKTEDPAAIALKKKKEAERKKQQEEIKKKQEEAERRKQEQLEAERKRKAEAAAKAAEKKKYDDAKSKFGDLFGGGEGKGNTGKPGNQGDPGGDPNSDILEGISTGKGRVGGGLGDRGVKRAPTVTDNSQKTGVVVIKVCVDNKGNVVGTPEYTQRGSTTSDNRLIQLAIKNARNWKFAPATIDKQCGTIKYDFKVK